ncbi:amidase family protein [Sneathiella glossodoripedis]|uniref:amidase family protein n=1 Tax=Sneathiella glossodoripedis TaxID=418853 RepID=UPI001900861F|nr:amidase family protein [Sneathiella glossodoripedis]
MTDLAFISAVDLLEGYKKGKISPVEATRAALDQIEKYDHILNAFVFTDPDAALASARQSEDRWRRGEPLGLLDGVPTTVKDIMLMKGYPTLKGSRLVDPAGQWESDSPAVARLREHGCVFIGKTTTPEFGWKGVTDSPLSGITRNPWDSDKTPGGSSGGASAACAAGMGVLHTGSDGGGSIRIPAALTGIFGYKASFGRVPVWPASAFGTVSHVGPMTRTVSDACLMMDVMKGYDSRDWYALPNTDDKYREITPADLKGRKIAYSATLGYAKVDSEVLKLVEQAVDVFRGWVQWSKKWIPVLKVRYRPLQLSGIVVPGLRLKMRQMKRCPYWIRGFAKSWSVDQGFLWLIILTPQLPAQNLGGL